MTNYDVIVVGVGGMGSSACYHLAKRGLKVLGLEQFSIAHDQGSSHGETRMIRRAYFEHSDYIPLLNRAFELWEELEKESGKSIFLRNGVVIYGNPETSSVYRGTVKSAHQYKIPIEEWSHQAALERFPLFKPESDLSAVYEPGAGFLKVESAVETHVECAKKHGAVIHANEKLLDFSATRNGVVVRTDKAEYQASKLVVTGGGWNNQILKTAGLPLTLRRMVQYWFKASSDHALNEKNQVPCFAFHTGENFYYGFPMLDGKTIKVAEHFSREPIQEPSEKQIQAPPLEKIRLLQEFIQRSLPKVSTELDRFSACIYTMTPDENFLIDRHPSLPHVVFAAGFSGHGFKFSSVVGEILADLAIQGSTPHPIGFLRIR